jgi:hypothetical protein
VETRVTRPLATPQPFTTRIMPPQARVRSGYSRGMRSQRDDGPAGGLEEDDGTEGRELQ